MRRSLVAFVLAVPLVTTAPSRLLDPFWAFFSSLWGSPAAPQLQPKAGCGADPSGRCLPAAPQPHPNAGCELDPSGRCNPGS
jgi:hypothetical protein